jgi:hypothetical protein
MPNAGGIGGEPESRYRRMFIAKGALRRACQRAIATEMGAGQAT